MTRRYWGELPSEWDGQPWGEPPAWMRLLLHLGVLAVAVGIALSRVL